MSRQPSDATTIKRLRRDVRDEHALASRVQQENIKLRWQIDQAKVELTEWKRRFDLLLARTPEVRP